MAAAVVTDDYYAILGVSHLASTETIREAYKKLALRYHPDKNHDESATQDFQRLVLAWETLKDGSKRREYDRNWVWAVRNRFEEVNRRRNEVDREATAHWNSGTTTPMPDEVEMRLKASIWKESARKDYIVRLQGYTNFRDGHFYQIKERLGSLKGYEANLEAQLRISEEEMIKTFQDAIQRSREIGHKIQDHGATLSRLLAARENYINRQKTSIEEERVQLRKLVHEIESRRGAYDAEEAISRQMRVQEALEILGPRDLSPPLFSMIDRRGQAINHWKALSRVQTATKFFLSLQSAEEGSYHAPGEWERIGGDEACGRCDNAAFHIMLECGPAKCPGCGIVVCNNCHRDLQLLREYDDWIRSPPGTSRDSFFSLEFSTNVKPQPRWPGGPAFGCVFEDGRGV